MAGTTPKGLPTRANTDPADFAADLTAIANAVGDELDVAVPTPSDLPALGNWLGRQRSVAGKGVYEVTALPGTWTPVGVQLLGNNGLMAGSGSPRAAFMQTGYQVVTTSGSGGFTLPFPTPFPNGVLAMSVVNGDPDATPGYSVGVIVGSVSASQFGIRVRNAAGAAFAGSYRLIWTAWGW
ncbi:hypothetical protein [Plantibacter sp. M259]|uniref:gp53-like domain-containing protein n=1 Tax=Plantibacter sp. M259 TaxID=2583822 RepID=UPI00110FFBFD|nr:hypothetical protein [Plantibacter sp. M259]